MQRLIVLSDLWGKGQSSWWSYYQTPLKEFFELQWYDSCLLGGVNLHPYQQENLHHQFINGGIDRAVSQLINQEKEHPPSLILAFSVGGVIAWQAVIAGLDCPFFYAVSATRLRKQSEIFPVKGKLLYGAGDAFQPKEDWLSQQIYLESETRPLCSHELYTKPETATDIVATLLGYLST